MGKVGTLKTLVVATVAAAALLTIAAVSGAAPGTEASVSGFDQCANGGPPSTATDCPQDWINGILNANNSHYAEDDVTPQRVILDLPKNGPIASRTVEISFLTRKGGVHAYDSLATWNQTQTSADRCANLNASDCVPGSASTLAIPSDPTVVADLNGSGTATSGHQLGGGQVFTLYGGQLTGASAYTHDDPAGSGDEYAHITLTYSVPSTADGAKVMLLFGGHLAPSIGPRGWGAGVGAGSISGGPYHIRITAADGASVGNRDNQIMSGAILAPANIVIHKVAVGGDGTFGYTGTGGISSPFSITTSGGNGSQSFTSLSAGSYTVTESAPPPAGTSRASPARTRTAAQRSPGRRRTSTSTPARPSRARTRTRSAARSPSRSRRTPTAIRSSSPSRGATARTSSSRTDSRTRPRRCPPARTRSPSRFPPAGTRRARPAATARARARSASRPARTSPAPSRIRSAHTSS